MRKSGGSAGREQGGERRRYLPLKEFAREALWETVMASGPAFVEEAPEAGRIALCGARRTRGEFADLGRAARAKGRLVGSITGVTGVQP